ncbi:MAG: hypothetical protein V2A55_00455 [Candidatus Jorgensenbacteria bacterium]
MERVKKTKLIGVLIIILICLLFTPVLVEKAFAMSILRPFGGRILAILPNLNPYCPAGTNIAIIGPPVPTTVLFTNSPPLVKNGPAKIGSWALGLATPPILTCPPVVFTMGVSSRP